MDSESFKPSEGYTTSMLIGLVALCLAAKPAAITFESLLSEMADLRQLAEYPSANWRCLQASSYNRESVHRDKPGWFADSDGEGFIRTEEINGHTEWVMMEHEGPGAITKMWTPFFNRDFNDRVGPNIRIYLDGSKTPLFDESFIKLVTGKGLVGAPWAEYTARAGNCYLPIPFAKSANYDGPAAVLLHHQLPRLSCWNTGQIVAKGLGDSQERCFGKGCESAGKAVFTVDDETLFH